MQGEKATRSSVNPHRLRWTISSPIDPKEGIFQEKKKISLRLKIVEKGKKIWPWQAESIVTYIVASEEW